MRRSWMITALVAAVLLSAAPARAGWIIDEVVRGGVKSERSRHRVFMEANRLKVVVGDGVRQRQATVMDLDRQTITHIDYPTRSYTIATTPEYAELMREGSGAMSEGTSQIQGQLKDMEERLRSLPPEQRRAVEAMMKQVQEPPRPAPRRPEDCAADKAEVKNVGRRITVAGYEASGYRLFTSGRLDSEVYIAPAITAAHEIDPQKLERMVTELIKALPQCPPHGQMFGAGPAWKLMKDGYPVRTVGMGSGQITEVVKAERRSLGADEFEPPAGFARKTLKEMMGGK